MTSMYIDLVIVEARNIKAADINGFSDPYVLLKKVKGVLSEAKTPTINKTLNPVWNYKATVKVDYNLHALIFELYDHDAVTKDDHLGSVLIKSSVFNDGIIVDTWEDIIGKDGKVYGQLHLQMEPHNLCTFCESNQTFSIGYNANNQVSVSQVTSAQFDKEFHSQGKFSLGLGWDINTERRIDLDASVLCFSSKLKVCDTVYFGHRYNSNNSIVHSGDNLTGAGDGDDEVITIDLDNVPKSVKIIACLVNCFSSVPLMCVDSAYVRVFQGNNTYCSYMLTEMVNSIGLFFCYFIRQPNSMWLFQTLGAPLSGNTAPNSSNECANVLKASELFKQFYPDVKCNLHLEVIEARNLKSADLNGKSDPYFVLYNNGNQLKSQVVKKTLNPTWNFVTDLILDSEDNLEIDLYDWDRFSSDDPLGSVVLTFSEYSQARDDWFPVYLKKKGVERQYGEIHLRLTSTITTNYLV